MQCATSAQASQSLCVEQFNSKQQFNSAQVLGINMMGNMVPVIYNVMSSVSTGVKGVVFYGATRYHRCFLYEDTRFSACCRLVMKFNIDHYFKCYLPGTLGTKGTITTPYTFNHCKKCDVGVVDDCGRQLAMTRTRHWTNGNLYWKACEVRQNCGDCDDDGFPRIVEEQPQQEYNGPTVESIVSNCEVRKDIQQ